MTQNTRMSIGDIEQIRESQKHLENRVTKLEGKVDTLHQDMSDIKSDIKLILADQTYTKKTLDKIDSKLSKLDDQQMHDHYIGPAKKYSSRREKLLTSIEMLIVAGFVIYLLGRAFPFISW